MENSIFVADWLLFYLATALTAYLKLAKYISVLDYW